MPKHDAVANYGHATENNLTEVKLVGDAGHKADAALPLYFYWNLYYPYHLSKENWVKKGDMKLVEIPNFCDLAMESHDPYQLDHKDIT